MKALAIFLVFAGFVQTVWATRVPVTLVRPTSKLVLKDNPFATELQQILVANTTAQWNPDSFLNKIPNFTAARQDGFIPTIAEMELIVGALQDSRLKEIDTDALRTAYHKAVRQGLELALANGTALEMGDDVPAELAEAVREHIAFVNSHLSDAMQEAGIEGLSVALSDIVSDQQLEYLEAALPAEETVVSQTASAGGNLLNSYTSGKETDTNEEVESVETDAGTQQPTADNPNPAELEEDSSLTLPQVIDRHRQLYQQMLDNGASEKMLEISREALGNLETLYARQVEDVKQFKLKMKEENVSWVELGHYAAIGITSRFLVRPMIDKVEASKKSTMYSQLLEKLAEDSESAVVLLEQYFSGERVLSEAELQQVCLHTACDVGVRPMLAIERVLNEYAKLTEDVGDTIADVLSGEEYEIISNALAIYKPQLIEAKAEQEIQEVEGGDTEAEQEKLVAEKQATQEARDYNEARKREAAEQDKRQSYQTMADTLIEINSHKPPSNSILTKELLSETMKGMGFEHVVEGGTSHPDKMVTAIGNKLNLPNTHRRETVGAQRAIFKQARHLRFMEEMEKWTEVEGDWKAKRDLLVNYLNNRIGDTTTSQEQREVLNRLSKALNEMETTLIQGDE